MNSLKGKILLNSIVGDALGSPFTGMKKGHINVHFKEIADYVDPAPALKDSMYRWRKPGLYTSISQFMLLLAISQKRSKIDLDRFITLSGTTPDVSGTMWGIFRHPDGAEKNFITQVKSRVMDDTVPPVPSARIVAAMIPLSFRKSSPAELLLDIIACARHFTTHSTTLAGAISVSSYISHLIHTEFNPANSPIQTLLSRNDELVSLADSESGKIFEIGINPDYLVMSFQALNRVLKSIEGIDDYSRAEKQICDIASSEQNRSIKRASINNPLTLIPAVFAYAEIYGNSAEAIFHVSREGGASSALTALYAALAGTNNNMVPENLIQNLINRKRIVSLITSICDTNKGAGNTDEFLLAEASLTSKELQEIKSKLKHNRKKTKKIKSRKDKEKELAKHVVGSWTKVDKARWKKERKQNDIKYDQ